MPTDRRAIAATNAMAVARAYEEQTRRAQVTDVSAGTITESAAIGRAFAQLEILPLPRRFSADLLSALDAEVRIIEVKGRGASGPIDLPERELDTLSCAGDAGWMYVVWNTTQPGPCQLWLIRDPQRLPWAEVTPAKRPAGQPRGVSHEAKYRIESADVAAYGERADLSALVGLPTK